MIKKNSRILLTLILFVYSAYPSDWQNYLPDKKAASQADNIKTYYGPKTFSHEKWGEQTVICNGPTKIKKSHAKKIVIHGPSRLKKIVTGNTILVHGPSKMSQMKAESITVHGPLRMNETTVQDAIIAHGPTRMKSVKAKKATVLGPLTMSKSTVETLSITIKDSKSTNNRFVDLKDVTINGLLSVSVNQKNAKLYFENVIANNVTIIFEDRNCKVFLKGNTNFSGTIKFQNGKGRVYVADNASFKGTIDGGKLIEEK